MSDSVLFSPLVERAIELAAEWHDGVYRKGRWRCEPYDPPPEVVLRIPMIAHVTTVALTVQRAGWEDEVIAAAFLHDVLEDDNCHGQTMAPETMTALMGAEVTRLVAGVSEPKRDAGGDVLPWKHRKDAYLKNLKTAPPGTSGISLADKLHNLWTMNESLEAALDIFTSTATRRGLSAGPEAQRWYFRAVLEATRVHDDPRLVPQRARLEAEIRRFEALSPA